MLAYSAMADYPILAFADRVLGINHTTGNPDLTQLRSRQSNRGSVANFTGKTSVVVPICALWTLYCYPRARVMYLSATGAQVKNQFFASLQRFQGRPAFAGWKWLETEGQDAERGVLIRQKRRIRVVTSREFMTNLTVAAAIIVDEAKSIRDDVLDALSALPHDVSGSS